MPRTAERRQRNQSDPVAHERQRRTTHDQQTQDSDLARVSPAMTAQRKLDDMIAGSARQLAQQQRVQSIHASTRQAAQRKTLSGAASTIQRAAVMQLREVATIKVDIDALKAAVNGLVDLADDETAVNILAREGVINGHRATRTLLDAEIREKEVAHGRPVSTEVAINARLGQIPGELATATADVTAGSQPAPPKAASAWGPGAAAYRAWEAKSSKLAENQQKIIDLNAETASKTADIPIAQLVDARTAVDTKLAALDANLARVKQERYEYDLVTTVQPACKTFKDEDTWGSGPSRLGVFVYAMPAVLNGIACCIDPFEIHAHYQTGSKKIRKAHFRGGRSSGVNIYSGGAASPAQMGAWAGTIMALCNASIPS